MFKYERQVCYHNARTQTEIMTRHTHVHDNPSESRSHSPLAKEETLRLTAELIQKVNGSLTTMQFEAHPDTPSKSHVINKQFESWSEFLETATEYTQHSPTNPSSDNERVNHSNNDREGTGDGESRETPRPLDRVAFECYWRAGHYTFDSQSRDLPVSDVIDALQDVGVPDPVISQGIDEFLASNIHRKIHRNRHPVTALAAGVYTASKATDTPVLPRELLDALDEYGSDGMSELVRATREIESRNETPRLQPSIAAYLERFIADVQTYCDRVSSASMSYRDVAVAYHASVVASKQLPNRGNHVLAAGSILASFDRAEHDDRPVSLNALVEVLTSSDVTLNDVSQRIREEDDWQPHTVLPSNPSHVT